MKKRFIYCVIMLVVILLQGAAIPVFFDGYVVPSAIFMLALAWSIVDGFVAFLWWAIGLGLVTDLLTSVPVGSHVIAYVLLTYIAGFLSRRIMGGMAGGTFVLMMLFVISGTLVSRALRGALLFHAGSSFNSSLGVFLNPGAILAEVVINAIIFFVLLYLVRRSKKYFAIE